MRKFVSLFLATLLAFNVNSAEAAGSKSEPPSDLKGLQNRLSESMVGVTCGTKTGIAFTGNYSISQEDKNQGRYSLLVTNKDLIWSCLSQSSRTVQLTYQSKNYNGSIWGWSALNAEDYSTISSSLDLEPIGLYGRELPEVGWWVMVASYLPQFGVTWTQMKISAVNEKDFTLLLDSSPASLGTGGPVFDNSGTFLGIVTFVQNPNQNLAKVSGAPNVCNTKGSLSGTGIADCAAGTKEQIWKKISSSVTDSENGQSSNNSAELTKLIDLSYKTFQETVNECNNTYNSQEINLRTEYVRIGKTNNCSSLNSKALTISNSSKNSPSNNLLDQLNLLSEEIDIISAQMMDEFDQIKYVLEVGESLTSFKSFYKVKMAKLTKQLQLLPAKSKLMIEQSEDYLNLRENIGIWVDIEKILSFYNSRKSGLDLTYSDLMNYDDIPSIEVLNFDWQTVQNKIPKYACAKGKSVTELLGKSCSKGFVKTQLK